MHTFYLEAPSETGAQALLTQEESKHAQKVLRLSAGDEVCVLDGVGGRFAAEIEGTRDGRTVVRIGARLPDNEPGVRVTLWQGLPKADKLDWVAQKTCEMGLSALNPVAMARSVVRLDAKDAVKRRERLERIVREAAKQCRRAAAPRVGEACGWKAALTDMARHELLLTPWEGATSLRMADVHAQAPHARDIGIVIGPEGGISPEEIADLEAVGAKTVTLGPRILRTETAAIAAATLAMALWGDV